MALEIVAAFGIFDLFTGQTELDLTDRLVAINDSGFKYDLASNWLVYCIRIRYGETTILIYVVPELFTSWHILLLLVESGVIYGVLQFINAVMNVTPFTAPSTMVTFYVLQSILTSFSMAYPTLTVGIIRGPFSLVRVADTVVEIRSEGDSDERVITPHADPQSHHYVT
ncbi:hypothetical protein H0H93_008507 [Arthromyces matolae]|nr:hypothetical protein H0H93_008507 [Arthromyces matolae]